MAKFTVPMKREICSLCPDECEPFLNSIDKETLAAFTPRDANFRSKFGKHRDHPSQYCQHYDPLRVIANNSIITKYEQ